ncbi:MAG: EVE domain-containing protein, partial [Halobacteriota archaeon]
CILTLVGQQHIYALGENTPGRKSIKPEDWICFYAQAKGVVAYARVASFPERKLHPKVRRAEKHPWVFKLENTALFLEDPVVIDASLRSTLDKFKILDTKNWGLFVKSTNKITEHDFRILTRQLTNE